MGQSLDLPAESFEDPTLASGRLFRPGRSFSEIDMTSLPDTDGGLGDLSLRPSVAFPTPARSLAEEPHRPLLAKRESLGSLSSLSHALPPVSQVSQVSPVAQGSQGPQGPQGPQETPVVKGSVNLTARSRQQTEEAPKSSPRARSVPPPKDLHGSRVSAKDFGGSARGL